MRTMIISEAKLNKVRYLETQGFGPFSQAIVSFWRAYIQMLKQFKLFSGMSDIYPSFIKSAHEWILIRPIH